jgi:outer membrane receptor protein involved in Fe transport
VRAGPERPSGKTFALARIPAPINLSGSGFIGNEGIISMTRRPLFAALLAGSALAGFAPAASAQIEEIVVTTRKRAESLQEVPIVITALTAETIQRKGIATLEDITKFTAGVSLEEGFSKQDTRITIRGLSPTRGRQNAAVLMDDVDLSSEAISTAGGSFFINPRLFDVERIEVVKGPHSALYGRSAFAGAINYITRKPGDTFQASVGADFGAYGKQEGRLSVSGPLVADKLSVGVNAAAWNFNGFYRNTITGRSAGGYDGGGASASAVFKPNDVLKFTLRGEYSKDHYDPEARTFLSPRNVTLTIPASAVGTVTAAGTTTTPAVLGLIPDASALPPVRNSTNPRTPGQDYPGTDRTIKSVTLRSEANFTGISVVSLSYIGDSHSEQYLDTLAQGDVTTLNAIQETHFITSNKVWSQDLRVQSNDTDSRLSWTFGGLFWNERTIQVGQSDVCTSTIGGCVAILSALGVTRPFYTPPNTYKRDTHNYSLYGMASFKITDSLSVEGEVRRTWETEHINAASTSTLVGCIGGQRLVNPATGVITCAIPGPQVQAPSYAGVYGRSVTPTKFWTPRVTVQYKAMPDAMVYVSAAEGKKPGGVLSLLSPSATGDFTNSKFRQEKLWVYELGAKTEWLDHRLRINADGYLQNFTDKQETGTQVGPDGLPIPGPGYAHKARVWGFEADAAVQATEGLSLTASYAYTHARYLEFNLQQSSAASIARGGNCTVVRPPVGAPYCSVNYAGKTLALTPTHSFTLGGEFKRNFAGEIDWVLGFDSKYVGKRFLDFNNDIILNSYWSVDLRLGLQTPKWEIIGYVNNLFDDDTLKSGAVALPDFNSGFLIPISPGLPSGLLATLPDKRQFGVRGTYRF